MNSQKGVKSGVPERLSICFIFMSFIEYYTKSGRQSKFALLHNLKYYLC